MQKSLRKLSLNQETLMNLTPTGLRNIQGPSGLHSACTCPTNTAPLSCIECNPPK
jgi:hypothetical protein